MVSLGFWYHRGIKALTYSQLPVVGSSLYQSSRRRFKGGRSDLGLADTELVIYVLVAVVAVSIISSCNRCVYKENMRRIGFDVIEVQEGEMQEGDVPVR